MIRVNIEPGRLHRSCAQSFHLMKTSVNCIFTVLGTMGNAHIIVISKLAITCNCPNHVPACKHVLFLLSLCGGLSCRRQLLVSPALLGHKLHADPSTSQLKAAMLLTPTLTCFGPHTIAHLVFSVQSSQQEPSSSVQVVASFHMTVVFPHFPFMMVASAVARGAICHLQR